VVQNETLAPHQDVKAPVAETSAFRRQLPRPGRDLLAGLPLLLIFAGTFLLVLLSPWP